MNDKHQLDRIEKKLDEILSILRGTVHALDDPVGSGGGPGPEENPPPPPPPPPNP